MRQVFASGAAAERFERMVAALGGPPDFLDDFEAHLAGAPEIADVTADATGFVAAIDTRALGLAVVELGGGRRRASDTIDPAVGLEGCSASAPRSSRTRRSPASMPPTPPRRCGRRGPDPRRLHDRRGAARRAPLVLERIA